MPEESEEGAEAPRAPPRPSGYDEYLGGFFSFPLTLILKCADPYSYYGESYDEPQGEPRSALRAMERDFERQNERLEGVLRRTELLHEETQRALAAALAELSEPRCRPEAQYARALRAHLAAELRGAEDEGSVVLEGALAKLEALNYASLEQRAEGGDASLRTEEPEMQKMRRSSELQGLKTAAAARAALEVELKALRARLDRGAAEAQRSRAETEALREETLRLEAQNIVLAGAKRELEESKASERSSLMSARSELEDLTARLTSTRAASEASEEALRRLKGAAAKEAAAARRAEELLSGTSHERDALVESHAELGSTLLGLLKALMSLDSEVQRKLYADTQSPSCGDVDNSANSSELLEMHAELTGAHDSVVEGLQEAVSRLRAVPSPAESLLGQKGSSGFREDGSLNGSPGHQGPQEEEAAEAEEERAGAVARLHASMVAAEALVEGLQGKLRSLDGRPREVVELEEENSELLERLAGAEEVMAELREETAAAAGMFVEAREAQEAEGLRIRAAEARMAEREAELLDEITRLREQNHGRDASAVAVDEELALVARAAQESLEDSARRSGEEAESARSLASAASEARGNVEDLLQRFRDAARSHAELEKNNNLIHGSVEGLVDVVNDLKRMNAELVQENEALAVDRERLLLLEGRCEELEGMLRTAGVLEEGLLGTDDDDLP